MPIGARWTIFERERRVNNFKFKLLVYLFPSEKTNNQKITNNKQKQARRRSNLEHRVYPTRDGVNVHMVTVTRRFPDDYTITVNNITRSHIHSIVKFIIISLFAYIHSSNHTFDPTRVLPMPGKCKRKRRKRKETGQVVIEPRRSSLPNKIWRQLSHGDGYPTVTQQLHDAYTTIVNNITRPHISSIIKF
jgi:hypothetical protein